jgi:hypothetical protein
MYVLRTAALLTLARPLLEALEAPARRTSASYVEALTLALRERLLRIHRLARLIVGRPGEFFPGSQNGLHDSCVSGATAYVPAELVPEGSLIQARKPEEDVSGHHQHPGSAKSALQAVLLMEVLSEHVHREIVLHRLQCFDRTSLAGDRQGEAGARGNAVDENRTRAACAMLAAKMY